MISSILSSYRNIYHMSQAIRCIMILERKSTVIVLFHIFS